MRKIHSITGAIIIALMMLSEAAWGQGNTPTGIKVQNNTLVPLRAIAELFSASVSFDTASNRITLQTATSKMLLMLGSTKAAIGDKEYVLPTPAIARNGITYVPLRFVAYGFHAKIQWDEAKQQATITNPESGKTLTIGIASSVQANASTNAAGKAPSRNTTPTRAMAPVAVNADSVHG